MAQAFPSVSAVATDLNTLEAAAELLANKDQPSGYPGLNADGDIVAIIIPRLETASDMNGIVLAAGEVGLCSDSHDVRMGDGATSGGFSTSQNSSYLWLASPRGTPAQNGTTLAAAYTAAKARTPGAASLSATNRSTVYLPAGTYTLQAPLTLDTAYVDVIGAGSGLTIVNTTGDNNVRINADNITLKGITFNNTNADTAAGILHINAGAGGSYASTNTGLVHEDLVLNCLANGDWSVQMNASITTFGGTYRRITTNTCNLYSAQSPTGVIALSCSGTFEDCFVNGGQGSSGVGGLFGGTTNGSGPNAPNVFTGILRRCRWTANHCGLLNRGRVEFCHMRNAQGSRPTIYAGNAGKFYYNWMYCSSTGSPYCIGYYETASISAAFNVLRTNGIDSGSGITNLIDTPYNVTDNDYATS